MYVDSYIYMYVYAYLYICVYIYTHEELAAHPRSALARERSLHVDAEKLPALAVALAGIQGCPEHTDSKEAFASHLDDEALKDSAICISIYIYICAWMYAYIQRRLMKSNEV